MTRRGWTIAGIAGALSALLHAGGLIALSPAEPQALAGGPAQLAMIGNSFEDAVAGSVTGATEAEAVAPTEVTAPEPIRPSPVAERIAAVALPPAPIPPAPSVSSASPVAAPVVVNAAPVVAPATRVAPAETTVVQSSPAMPEAAVAPRPETVTARDAPIARTPDAETPRPQPPRVARTAPRPTRPATPQAPQGNAAETARAGDAQGAAQGNATRTQAGAGGQSARDGQAAAAYPQLVNRHLSRLRRPNSRFDGVAVVAFSIAGNGGLAGLSIARSSGNAEFDRLALAHIQRAAPFPPPPAGAQRSFNVAVQGR